MSQQHISPESRLSWDALSKLAKDARLEGDHESALTFFRQAFELHPLHPALPVEIAVELRELGRLEESRAILAELLERQPGSLSARIAMGRTTRRIGDHESALAHFQEAHRLDPDHVVLPVEIAAELRELRRYEESRALLEELLERRPDSLSARIALGLTARKRGDRESALEHFQEAFRLRPDHPGLPVEIATELRVMGRIDEACAYLRESLSNPMIHPGEALNRRGRLATHQGDEEAAKRFWNEGIRRYPGHPACFQGLIAFHLHQGEPELARHWIDIGAQALNNPTWTRQWEGKLSSTTRFINVYKEYQAITTRILETFDPRKILKTDAHNEAGVNPIALPLAPLFADRWAVLVEFDDYPLRAAQNKLAGCDAVHFAQGDIRQLPFLNSQFDSVLDFSTIDHIPPDAYACVLGEYSRVCERNGVVSVVYWTSEQPEQQEAPWRSTRQYYFSDPSFTECFGERFHILEKRKLLDDRGHTLSHLLGTNRKAVP